MPATTTSTLFQLFFVICWPLLLRFLLCISAVFDAIFLACGSGTALFLTDNATPGERRERHEQTGGGGRKVDDEQRIDAKDAVRGAEISSDRTFILSAMVWRGFPSLLLAGRASTRGLPTRGRLPFSKATRFGKRRDHPDGIGRNLRYAQNLSEIPGSNPNEIPSSSPRL